MKKMAAQTGRTAGAPELKGDDCKSVALLAAIVSARAELTGPKPGEVLGIPVQESPDREVSLATVEGWLARELEVGHRAAVALTERGLEMLEKDLAYWNDTKQRWEERENFGEPGRLLGLATRFMRVVQDGAVALAKIRSGGRQVVTVQHVAVSNGGQAVVAGTLESSCGEGGR